MSVSIKSGASSDQLTIGATNKAARVELFNADGTPAVVDANGNVMVTDGVPPHPAAGGFYTVSGAPTGIVAAALAADTSLVAMRLALASTRTAYLTKFRLNISPATLGAAGGVGGVLGLQRITTATPSGGTARTPHELWEAQADASDMNVQDLASALTVTSVVFGAEVGWMRMPHYVSSGGWFEWIFEPQHPVVLTPGDGLVLRTRVACAATQTWVYAYTAHWYEK